MRSKPLSDDDRGRVLDLIGEIEEREIKLLTALDWDRTRSRKRLKRQIVGITKKWQEIEHILSEVGGGQK